METKLSGQTGIAEETVLTKKFRVWCKQSDSAIGQETGSIAKMTTGPWRHPEPVLSVCDLGKGRAMRKGNEMVQ